MRFSHQESDRSNFNWPLVRLPKIRIAVPSILDDVKRQPEQKKVQNTAHRDLLDQFRCDMDGFMPQPVARRAARRR